MNSRINVLIPDGDSTWALSVIQCLSQVKDYKLFVLSNKKRSPSKFSKYTFYYKYYERPEEAKWLEVINSEIEAHNIDVIVPIAEKAFAFFIRNSNRISQAAKVIALPALDEFSIAVDKKKLSVFAKQHAIPHPKSFYLLSQDDREPMLSHAQFPLLIKPLGLKGGDGIKKIETAAQFPTTIEAPLFIQEYIEGYDIDCSVLCHNGTILAHTIQKGNLKGDTIYAPQLGFDFIDNEGVLKVTTEVMSKLNWSGVAHLDLRYDEKEKNYKLIEINARFWGSVEASKVAGINFPDLCVRFTLGKTLEDNIYKHISYMRLKGVVKSIKRNPLFIFKRNYLMNNTEAKTFLSDPLPTIYKFREWLGRQF
ncbi:ATP-grasp domain-containing protein [Psychroserpens algicola]|uniref:ATP-grasp domain-containing protein n=1 Tax=Psychroserpens algicola TaxID=1719034 RepID=UPI0019539D2D|nr:ATP-grasp domain-containing protein [Psychroserpens algicola]